MQLEAVYATAPVALCLVDRDGRYVLVNDALARMFGLAPRDLIGRQVAEFDLQAHLNCQRDFRAFDAGEMVPEHELALGGRVYTVTTRPFRHGGAVAGLTTALTDITDRKRLELRLAEANRRLRTFARRDALTGLGNRAMFAAAFALAFRRTRRSGAPLSLLMFDVDHFKAFNDRYGHPAGDDCLRRIAHAAKAALLRPDDILCRYGGEEFVAVLPGSDAEAAMTVAERLRAAVAALAIPHAEGVDGTVSVSGGTATHRPADGGDGASAVRADLLAAADAALYDAKGSGRNRFCAAP